MTGMKESTTSMERQLDAFVRRGRTWGRPGVSPHAVLRFPPTRTGRNRIVIGESGELREQAPGPDDRSRDKGGPWRALGMNRFGLGGTPDQPDQVIEILEAGPDVLKIRER